MYANTTHALMVANRTDQVSVVCVHEAMLLHKEGKFYF